jgi:hypothetical protein
MVLGVPPPCGDSGLSVRPGVTCSCVSAWHHSGTHARQSPLHSPAQACWQNAGVRGSTLSACRAAAKGGALPPATRPPPRSPPPRVSPPPQSPRSSTRVTVKNEPRTQEPLGARPGRMCYPRPTAGAWGACACIVPRRPCIVRAQFLGGPVAPSSPQHPAGSQGPPSGGRGRRLVGGKQERKGEGFEQGCARARECARPPSKLGCARGWGVRDAAPHGEISVRPPGVGCPREHASAPAVGWRVIIQWAPWGVGARAAAPRAMLHRHQCGCME